MKQKTTEELPNLCVSCGNEFPIDELSHVWMDYDPDYLEEGDEESVYAGLVCKKCLKEAAKLMPVMRIESTDEEEIA